MKTNKIYRNKNFKRRSKTTMFLEDHLSWIERNRPEGMARDGFIQHLIALGIKEYTAEKLS